MIDKDNLTEKCTAIFTSYGAKVSMDEMARVLGVSKRTLYEFFDSKENLIYECINFIIARVHALIDVHANNSNVIGKLFPMSNPNLQKIIADDNRFLMDVRRFYPDIFRETIAKHIESYQKYIIDILKTGIEQGVFLHDINTDIITDVIFTIHRSLRHREISFEKYSSVDLFKNTVLCYLRGISTPKGIEMIEETLPYKDFDIMKWENSKSKKNEIYG
jgi:AcrR family transcriptional regulator